jgi:hypothetical protein
VRGYRSGYQCDRIVVRKLSPSEDFSIECQDGSPDTTLNTNEDIREKGLQRGNVGTVVELLDNGYCEIESMSR